MSEYRKSVSISDGTKNPAFTRERACICQERVHENSDDVEGNASLDSLIERAIISFDDAIDW